MRIKLISTGEIAEFESGYAVRLIEQGKAVPVPAPMAAKPRAAKAAEKAEDKAEGK